MTTRRNFLATLGLVAPAALVPTRDPGQTVGDPWQDKPHAGEPLKVDANGEYLTLRLLVLAWRPGARVIISARPQWNSGVLVFSLVFGSGQLTERDGHGRPTGRLLLAVASPVGPSGTVDHLTRLEWFVDPQLPDAWIEFATRPTYPHEHLADYQARAVLSRIENLGVSSANRGPR